LLFYGNKVIFATLQFIRDTYLSGTLHLQSEKDAREVTNSGWCFFETGEKIAFMFHPII
jgi:hypothetical protein